MSASRYAFSALHDVPVQMLRGIICELCRERYCFQEESGTALTWHLHLWDMLLPVIPVT